MGRGPSVTDDERTRMKSMRDAGYGLRAIGRLMSRSSDTVRRALEVRPHVHRQTGAPPRLSKTQVRQLVHAAATGKFTTAQLKDKFKYPCSTRTIQRALAKYAEHKHKGSDGAKNSDWDSEEPEGPETPRVSASDMAPNGTANPKGVASASVAYMQLASTHSTANATVEAFTMPGVPFAGSPVRHASLGVPLIHPNVGTGNRSILVNGVADRPVMQSTSSLPEASDQSSSLLAAMAPDIAAQSIMNTLSHSARADRTDDPRILEVLAVVRAQGELLRQQNVQLERQATSIDALIQHLIHRDTS
ncbi:hypothetical protein BBJ28_00005601 [Nothophytophthora sp. Chile5]|nr:hypothetical protein BBJ28_00005601 [Nothophytophthora sp. Chile5]